MCPSSKITRDRRHSPKGRAGLMREWLRLLEHKGVDVLSLEQNIHGWSVKKLLEQTVNKVRNHFIEENKDDFSHEVMTAMSGCLACKACASQCPIKVDVPDFRARFVNLYHTRYFRPLKDHLVANVEILAPLMAKAPKLVNSVLESTLYDKLSSATIGYVNTPLLSVPTLKANIDRAVVQGRYENFDLAALQRLSETERKKYLLIVQDPFTSFYDAKTVEAMMELAHKLGYKPILLPFKPNGKAQHVKGFLRRFAKTAQNTANFLNELHRLNIPMVGVDGSLVLCYRDEYKQVLKDKRGDFQVLLAHEWLLGELNEKPLLNSERKETEYKLFAHCTEKTMLPNSEKQWVTIFNEFGLSLNIVAVGCCGMAGTYGHEKVNAENSKGLFELSWQQKLSSLDESQVLVTGFSCRSQVKRFGAIKAKHPITALLASLN